MFNTMLNLQNESKVYSMKSGMTHALIVALTVVSPAMGYLLPRLPTMSLFQFTLMSIWQPTIQVLCSLRSPLSSNRQHLSYDACLEVRVKSELFRATAVLCTEVVYSHQLMMVIMMMIMNDDKHT